MCDHKPGIWIFEWKFKIGDNSDNWIRCCSNKEHYQQKAQHYVWSWVCGKSFSMNVEANISDQKSDRNDHRKEKSKLRNQTKIVKLTYNLCNLSHISPRMRQLEKYESRLHRTPCWKSRFRKLWRKNLVEWKRLMRILTGREEWYTFCVCWCVDETKTPQTSKL
jgi:hypothetical protein